MRTLEEKSVVCKMNLTLSTCNIEKTFNAPK